MTQRFKNSIFLLFFSLIYSHSGFSQGLEEQLSPEAIKSTDDDYLKMVMNGSNRFAFDLYQALKSKQGNFTLAPYALATGIGMVGDGAKGETRLEIQKALHFSLNLAPLMQTINLYLHANLEPSKQKQLSLISAVWLQNQNTLLPSYKFSLKRNFNFTLEPLNFHQPSEAFNQINRWAVNNSKGKINQIVSYENLSRNTQFLLTTGFYWKAEWLHPFDLKQTRIAPFIYRGYSFNVEMMKQIAAHSILTDSRFVIIEIPFKPFQEGGAQLSFTILLPNEGVNLNAIENELMPEQWYRWMGELKPQLVELFLPKLILDDKRELSDVMEKIGIRLAFNGSADFSAINEEKIFLNKIVQKVVGKIDESGSDAFISRSTKSQEAKEGAKPYIINVNRPFFFVIQEMTTRLILAIGKVEKP